MLGVVGDALSFWASEWDWDFCGYWVIHGIRRLLIWSFQFNFTYCDFWLMMFVIDWLVVLIYVYVYFFLSVLVVFVLELWGWIFKFWLVSTLRNLDVDYGRSLLPFGFLCILVIAYGLGHLLDFGFLGLYQCLCGALKMYAWTSVLLYCFYPAEMDCLFLLIRLIVIHYGAQFSFAAIQWPSPLITKMRHSKLTLVHDLTIISFYHN